MHMNPSPCIDYTDDDDDNDYGSFESISQCHVLYLPTLVYKTSLSVCAYAYAYAYPFFSFPSSYTLQMQMLDEHGEVWERWAEREKEEKEED